MRIEAGDVIYLAKAAFSACSEPSAIHENNIIQTSESSTFILYKARVTVKKSLIFGRVEKKMIFL